MRQLTIGQSIARDLCEADAPIDNVVEVDPTDVARRIDFEFDQLRQKNSELTAEVERLRLFDNLAKQMEELDKKQNAELTAQLEQLAVDYNTLVEKTGRAIIELTAQRDAAMKDAERWRLASTSRNFGIANWCEYGQRTSYDAYACQLIDAAIANCKDQPCT